MQVLIGADPELFVKKTGSASFESAHGLIPGTKVAPFKVDKGAVQVDGMALEFNIDPAQSADEFYTNITEVMKTLQGMVPQHQLVIDATARFSDQIMKGSPKEALELGCDPDYNCYTHEENPRPKATDERFNLRTAAGHIHIGWTEGMDVNDAEHKEACEMLCQQLDFFLGVPSMLWDADRERKQLYGKAGAYRPKSYGMEYRVLSNAWLQSEELIRWVYQATVKAFEELAAGRSMFNDYGQWARGCIDKEDHGPNSEKVYRRFVEQILELPPVPEVK